ncbi:MAG: hypothetical protein OXI87_07935 [Albidovulum sp.]|nr:hypothetical protein [Albidovulum sp.]
MTDIRIDNQRLEQSASLGAGGTFRFDYAWLDRQYDYILSLGICPDRVTFTMRRKGAVSENRAGTSVGVTAGQAATCKLATRLSEMDERERDRPVGSLRH